MQAVCSVCVALHVLEFLMPAPARYPDLYPVLNVLISTPVFVLTWLWSMKRGLEARWALGSLGGGGGGGISGSSGGSMSHGHSKSISQDMSNPPSSSSSKAAASTAEGSNVDGVGRHAASASVGSGSSIGRESGYRAISLGVGGQQVHHRAGMRSPSGGSLR